MKAEGEGRLAQSGGKPEVGPVAGQPSEAALNLYLSIRPDHHHAVRRGGQMLIEKGPLMGYIILGQDFREDLCAERGNDQALELPLIQASLLFGGNNQKIGSLQTTNWSQVMEPWLHGKAGADAPGIWTEAPVRAARQSTRIGRCIGREEENWMPGLTYESDRAMLA
jgi:hypothetical protein